MGFQYRICKATERNIGEIKIIADANRDTIGFILRPALLEAMERKELIVVKALNNKVMGFINYHHRQDRQTTIYEICVKTSYRHRGIGRRLIRTVVNEAYSLGKDRIVLKCPEGLPANRFYSRLGFCHVSTENGKKRRLNVWEFRVEYENPTQLLLPIDMAQSEEQI